MLQRVGGSKTNFDITKLHDHRDFQKLPIEQPVSPGL
jgi:hypothetical protein